MSKVTLLISIDFQGEGQERESLCVNLTINRENPSDDHIAQCVYDEMVQHLYENERFEAKA